MESLEQRLLLTFQGVAAGKFTPFDPANVELADLDNDGDLDAFVTANVVGHAGDDGSEKVWFNDGSGVFTDSGQRLGAGLSDAAGTSPGTALGDFDNDGDVDAFVSSLGGADRLYLNDGSGFFSVGTTIATPIETYAVVAGDVDADGDLDIIAHTGSSWQTAKHEVWLNDGNASFNFSSRFGAGILSTDLDLGDVDGDGDLDLLDGTHGTDWIWLNDGVGSFSDSGQEFRLTDPSNQYDNPRTWAVEFGDIDNDGDLDFVSGKNGGPDLLYINDGTGQFTDSGQALVADPGPKTNTDNRTRDLTLADIDGDGDLDIAVALETQMGAVWLNDGAGQFTSHVQLHPLSPTDLTHSNWRIAVGDVDGDQDLDAILLRRTAEMPDIVYFNQGFAPPNSAPVATADAYDTDEDTLLSPTGTGAYASAVLTDSPLGYWRLGESSGATAVDSSGRGNDGTFNGAVTLGSTGAIADGDTSISLTSSAGYVDAGNPADLDISDDTLTIEAWINPSAVQTAPIAGKSKSGQNDYTLWVVNNRAHFNLYNGSGEVYPFNGTIQMPVGQWSHVVGTYDGTTARIYVNGVLDSQKAFSGNISGNDALNFEIGRRTNGGNQFRGGIDEVALYGDALSADRVLAHFEAASEAGGAGGSVLDNDTDADGDALTVTALNGDSNSIGQATVLASGATITLNADGTFQYAPTTSASFNALAVGESTTDSFTYTIDDGNGETNSATVTVTVNGVNDAPSVGSSGDVTVNEGQTATNSGTWSDADLSDVVTLSASVGTVTPNADGTWNWSFDTTDGPEDSRTVTITATDDDGAESQTSFDLTVANVAPLLKVKHTLSVDEGDTATTSGTWSDPGDDTVTLSASVGNIVQNADGTFTWSFDTSDGPDDSQTVAITATDSDGASTVGNINLTVNNVAPSITVNASAVTVDEGQTATMRGTWSDPGNDVVTVAASIGTVTTNADGTWDWSYFAADGRAKIPVTISATDGDAASGGGASGPANGGGGAKGGAKGGKPSGGAGSTTGSSSSAEFVLIINNVDPDFEAGTNETLLPAVVGSFTRSGIAITDPGDPETFTGTVDWGDGGLLETLAINQATRTFDLDHVYAADGVYTVSVTVDDGDLGAHTDSFDVTVILNTPPVANDDSVSTDEDSAATFNVLTNDTDEQNNIVASETVALTSPSAGVLTDNGNGSFTFNPNGAFESLAVNDSAQVSFDYRIEDSFGETDTGIVTITVNGVNDAPVISNGGDVTIDEGQTATNAGSWSDVDASDDVTLSASTGDVSRNADGTWGWSFNSADGPDESQTVVITADDGNGGVTTTSFELTVNNVAPTVTAVSSSNGTLESKSVDGSVTISGSFSDPGLDTHVITVNWGDGTVENVSVDQIEDSFLGSHEYETGGIFVITVIATDSDGEASAALTTQAVVQGVGLVDGTLYIIGTDGRDHVNIKINEKKDELKVDVKLNQGGSDGGSDGGKDKGKGKKKGGSDGGSDGGGDRTKATYTASAIDQIVAILCGGDDHYNGGSDGGSDIAISQIVLGGDGNDHIKGGRGSDVLVGGAGKDDLKGGSGSDILIGGAGKDKLKGGRGDDLLIGGLVDNQDDLSALDSALSAWESGNLSDALLALGNDLDDLDKDDLKGEKGSDHLIGGTKDKVKQ